MIFETDPHQEPDPLVCPMCKRAYRWEWDGDGWWPTCGVWCTDDHAFLCSKRCFLVSLRMAKEPDYTSPTDTETGTEEP